jgi:uncharacterized protein (TIGR01777 family)
VKIVIAGGTGFVGRPLVKRLLEEGHRLVVLSRQVDAFKEVPSKELKVEVWNAETPGAWASQVDGADAVVNLVGEGIAHKRWTRAQKEVLRDSRLISTRALVSAIAASSKKPSVLVNASAVGFYGPVESGEVDETRPPGHDFLGTLCAEWEAEAQKAKALGVRVVLMRLGVVLDKEAGALPKFLVPFKFYVGGPLGSGRQCFPWVHRSDVVGAIVHALQNPSLSGPVNVTAPGILTMGEFCATLGKVMNRPSWAPVPGFALRLILGEMAGMLLTGQKAVPERLEATGYRFRYAGAEQALRQILQK